MLTAEQNELLTRIGPGTPCGELMRRYWHPIAAVSELEGLKWNKRVRLLGEDLVLLRTSRAARPDHRAVPAPPRFARVRHPDQGRHPLPLSRLGVRPARRMPRAAERAGEEPVPSQGEDAGLCGRGTGRRVSGPTSAPPETKPLLPRLDGFVAEGTIRMLGRAIMPVQLAPDHGELARPGPHRMAARPHLGVHQGAEGPGAEGGDQRAPREDRVP